MVVENLALIKMAQQGDKEAKNELINQNYPLIKSVIKRYKNKGVDYDDLFQLGCVGFVKAINNFDVSFNVKFSTYAVPMIAGEVKRFLRDDGSIKVSRALKTLSIQIKKFVESEEKLGKSPTIGELAKKFNVDEQEIVFAMDSSIYPVSLFSKVDGDEDGACLGDCIKDESQENVLDHFVLKDLIKKLDEREKLVITLRYYRDKTQSEIAKMLNISQVQVSRIENKVLKKLKKDFQN